MVAAVIAAVGTALVFLYVRGVDARASEQFDAVEVLKAVEIISPGETLQDAKAAGKIEMGTVGRGEVLDGATTSTADIGSKVALTSVFPGEQIITARFGKRFADQLVEAGPAQSSHAGHLSDGHSSLEVVNHRTTTLQQLGGDLAASWTNHVGRVRSK